MHSKQKKGCWELGLTNATQTNPSFAQREYGDGIISPSNSIAATVRARHCAYKEEEALGIISKDINYRE